MSTGAEMAKWMKFLLDNATTQNGEKLLTNEQLQDAFSVSKSIDHIYLDKFRSDTEHFDRVIQLYY